MPCWQEVWDNNFNLKSYKNGQKFPVHPPGVVVGASADMVLQPYGAFLAGAPSQCLHLLMPLNAFIIVINRKRSRGALHHRLQDNQRETLQQLEDPRHLRGELFF